MQMSQQRASFDAERERLQGALAALGSDMEQQEREIRGLAEAEHMARDVAESHWVRKACYSLKNVTCCQGLRVQFSGEELHAVKD